MSVPANQLLECLGKPHIDEQVKATLSAVGLGAAKIKLKRGEFDLALAAEKYGVDINFSDPSDYELDGSMPDGALVVSTVFFFKNGVEKHAQFGGELPHKLKFEMSRKEVRALLGKPEWSSPALPNDRWKFGKYKLVVDFNESEKSIDIVSCGLTQIDV